MTRPATTIATISTPRINAGAAVSGALLPIILVLASPIAGAEAPA